MKPTIVKLFMVLVVMGGGISTTAKGDCLPDAYDFTTMTGWISANGGCQDLQTANCGMVARGARQFGSNGLAGQLRFFDGFRRKLLEESFLGRRRGLVYPRVDWVTKLGR